MHHAVDPDLRPALEFVPRLDLSDVAATRELLRSLNPGDPMDLVPETVTVDRRTAPAGDGTEIGLVVFTPAASAAETRPGVVFFHGGGFVLGDAATDVRTPSRLAAELGAVVVSVNYRLAPEWPFPTPFDDCFDALRWTAGSSTELGIDPDRIAVAGTSAGAGLAAAVALKARNIGGPSIRFQALDSPVLDDRLSTTSATEYTDTPMWTRQNAIDSWNHYLGPDADRAATPEYAAPARATDLAGLPAAFLSVAAFDPLRDEGIDYARRLTQAAVPTELHLTPGTFHGSSGLVPQAGVSARTTSAYIDALRRAFYGTEEQ